MAKSRKKRKATRRRPTAPAQRRVPAAPPEEEAPPVETPAPDEDLEQPPPDPDLDAPHEEYAEPGVTNLAEGPAQEQTEEPAEPGDRTLKLAAEPTEVPTEEDAETAEPARNLAEEPIEEESETADPAQEYPSAEAADEPADAPEVPAPSAMVPAEPEPQPGRGPGSPASTLAPSPPPAGELPATGADRSVETAPDGNMPVSTRHSWRRLGRLLQPRVSAGNLLAALMTLAVGFALVAQVQAAQDVGLQDLSETDLVGLLDDVTERADALEEEIRLLEADKRALQQGTGEDAAEAAEARLTSHQILAGTVPVQGPGITMSVSAPDGGFTPTMMIDVMQELRNAGAEAIQIGQVRVVASTWIGIVDGNLTVDGDVVEAPFRIVAIGDPHTLSGAMAIPGGFTDSVRGIGGDVQVIEGDSLVVDAVHTTEEPQYARPVPSE